MSARARGVERGGGHADAAGVSDAAAVLDAHARRVAAAAAAVSAGDRGAGGAASRVRGAERDAKRMAELTPLWWNYVNAAGALGEGEAMPAELVKYRWMLEELRVSLFAQELGTVGPVSVKRLWDQWGR